MKFLKRIDSYDKETMQFSDGGKPAEPRVFLFVAILSFLFSVTAGVLSGLYFLPGSVTAYLGIAAAAGCFVLFAAMLALFVFKKRFPLRVAVNDEYIFILKHGGYIRFDKFEVGEILYKAKGVTSGANGPGAFDFEIEKGKIVFKNEIKPIKRKIANPEKLAFVLLQYVLSPFSGVDWGVAYESLPPSRRSPAAF
jgi:hypothetical protein